MAVRGPVVRNITGMDDLHRALRSVAPATRRAVGRQLDWEVDMIYKLSQVYVPKDTRALMQSGRKEGPTMLPHGIEMSLSYGGSNLNPKTGEPTNNYVIYVHERLDTRHALPTRAKFLETAVQERLPAMDQRVARFVGREVELALVASRLASSGGIRD